MIPESRETRRQKTIDMVDTFLECEGLQTYTQRGLLIAEMIADDADLQRRHREAVEALTKIESLLRTSGVAASCIKAARMIAMSALITTDTTTTKEKQE